MSLRYGVALACIAFLCCALHPASAAELTSAASIVHMTTTGGASSITLDISIADNGAVPGCAYFIIKRNGSQLTFFERQPGVQNTFSINDPNVVPGQLYWYELTVGQFPVPMPTPFCDETQFRLAFGSTWSAPLDIPGHLGSDPIPIAHGTLVADPEHWPGAHLEPCDGSPYWWYFDYGLPAGFEQFIGQEVLMYGDYSQWDIQNGWIPAITSFELYPCAPVATANRTWGYVKSMYR